MNKAMHDIIDSVNNRHVQMVASVDLRWTEDGLVQPSWLFFQLLIYHFEILFWSPRISIYNSQQNFILGNTKGGYFSHHMLNTPTHIGSLALCFTFPYPMESMSQVFKKFFIFLNDCMGFVTSSSFMLLHCQKYQIVCFGNIMTPQNSQCAFEQLHFLLVIGDDDGMINLRLFDNFTGVLSGWRVSVKDGIEFVQGNSSTYDKPKSLQK